MRYLMICYTAKYNNKEFSSFRGYILDCGEPIPSFEKIREDCLRFASKDGDNFKFFTMNMMNFLDEADYKSFFGAE